MWVEKIDKRTRKSKIFYDEDTKKYKAEFTIHDRHFKNDSDQWEDIDESIVNDGADGFDKKCDKTRHIFRIASGGKERWYPRRDVLSEYVEIISIEYYDNRWRNLTLPAAVWKSQGAEWDMTDMYASITNIWRRIKSDFILKNSNAYTRLRFEIIFVGLTYNAATGELTSTTDGLVWGSIEKPTAKDANKVDVPVTQTYDGTYIEWSIDTTGATFPIDVDPTFKDGFGGEKTTYKDAELLGDDPDTNGTGDFWTIGKEDSYLVCNRGVIEFDFTSLTGVTVTSASLFLYENTVTNNTAHETWYVTVQRLLESWVESEVTWNKRNSSTSWTGIGGGYYDTGNISFLLLDITPASAFIEFTSASLVSIIQDYIDGTKTNYGFIVRLPIIEYGASYDYIQEYFYTSDFSQATYRPYFEVEYTEGDTAIIGSTVWGHNTGAQEGNIRAFNGNWTGTGMISGSGDSEKILLSTGNYMESEIINTGNNSIRLFENYYGGSGSTILKYRSGSSTTDCQNSEWQNYSGSFLSTGYVQLRMEHT